MKLFQVVAIDKRGQKTVSIRPNILEKPMLSWGPCELSFHPYHLFLHCEVDETHDLMPPEGLKLAISFQVLDDQSGENGLVNLSAQKIFHLLSEFVDGVKETLGLAQIKLVELKVGDENRLIFDLAVANASSFQQISLRLSFLMEGVDSLLFARGLKRGYSLLSEFGQRKILSTDILEQLSNVALNDCV